MNLNESASSGQSSMQLKQTSIRPCATASAVGCALAVFQAEIAINALGDVAVDAPERDGGQRAEKRAERTEHAAEKARDDDVHADEEQQHEADDPCADVEVLPDIDRRREKQIDRRQNDRAHRTVKQADGVEPADLQAAAEGRRDHRNEDDVLERKSFCSGWPRCARVPPRAFAMSQPVKWCKIRRGKSSCRRSARKAASANQQQAPEQAM